ncbi:hypothetical protein F5141DRAFT_1187254 [Pisolithus sp. B1]|nr:hypothetical protein F5141DRAFT_1187254 [Pisolithus sp. B1]
MGYLSPPLPSGISRKTPPLSAFSDFYGLPSNPVSIYNTGDLWPVRQGPEAQRVLREARLICQHPIQDVWPMLGKRIYELLDSLGVQWSTIDPVRFAEEGKEAGPLYLWVGVAPRSLSFEHARAAADGCKEILSNAHFPDAEVAFRESIFTQSAGPRLLSHIPFDDHTAIRNPFTPTLGIQIAPRDTPYFEGTGALYLRESSQTDRVFVLTARHVALPPPVHPNKLSRHLDAFGEAAEGENPRLTATRQELQGKLAKAQTTIVDIDEFHSEITKNWTLPSQRVIGHILYAPPISVSTGPKQFTEDWAVINLYHEKIDWDGFRGNVVYLGNKISVADFVKKMHPHPEGRSSYQYPLDNLLQVKGVVPEEEIRNPKQLDGNEEFLPVVKNGKTTGVTIGRGTGIESFVRQYDNYGVKRTSMEIAVYPYSYRDGAFSAPGDSGSIVVDGQGRIIGLLTGGTGTSDSTDVTYLTPYFWLDERVKEVFPNSYLYPIVY